MSRSRNGVGSTAHGSRVLAHAREVMRRTEQITDKAAAARGHLQGRLRVAAAPSALQLLPALIGELIRDHPDVDVVLLEGSDSEVCAWLEDVSPTSR